MDNKRGVAMGGLRLAKWWVETAGEEAVVCDDVTAGDLLRMWRNRIWKEYGCDELAAMETEIDLDL